MAKSTGFFFDVQIWKGSRSVQRMSFAERGVYLEMMVEQWEKRNLPDSPEAIAQIIASTPAQAREVKAAWKAVRDKFVTSRGNGSRIYNVPLERTRRAQTANRKRNQEMGKRGGETAARNRLARKGLQATPPIAIGSGPIAKPTDKTRQDKTETRQDALKAAHRGHAFCGSRFCVPTFLHEQFSNQLGSAGLAKLDLLTWYPRLDAREGPIAGDVLGWLRGQFAEASKVAIKAVPNTGSAYVWDCPHEPRCAHRSACDFLKTKSA